MEYSLTELRNRHSVRNFLTDSVPGELRRRFNADVTMINSQESGLNFQLIYDDPDPLKGFRRSYGMFHNARNYLAAVVDPTFANAEERAGYFAEQFVMDVVTHGLGACFISGTYSPQHVKARMEVYEKLLFIVAFGYSADKPNTVLSDAMTSMMHGRRMSAREFFEGTDQEYELMSARFPWLETGLEGMACAPSGKNRRGIRIGVGNMEEEEVLTAFCIKEPAPVDLGIAKYNFQAPLPVAGEWEWGDNGAFRLLEE